MASGLSLYALRNLNVPINYTDMSSIYSTVKPMDVYFMNQVEDGDSAIDFMNQLSIAAGENTLELKGKDWTAKGDEQSYVDYYTKFADDIPKETFGSYVIQ